MTDKKLSKLYKVTCTVNGKFISTGVETSCEVD